MVKNKIGAGIFLLAVLLVSMVFLPAVCAQKEEDYSITAEEAFKHANANMISFIAGNTPNFESWVGASIDPKPQELYDINGQKLFYQFSVFNGKKLIGIIDICASKNLGYPLNDISFDPEPYKATEAMKRSKKIAKNEYPEGEIKSTIMVVYSYPSIGAMTIVKDKTTGDEHRIFVDAYTLKEVQDKPVTEAEPGVWSMYEMKLENGVEKNLNEWKKSDQLIKSIEQAAANKEVNIDAAVSEEDIKKLGGDAAITASTSVKLGVPLRGQTLDIYCGEASIQMISLYYKYPTPSQDSIYDYFFDSRDQPSGLRIDEMIKWAEDKWEKTGTLDTSLTDSEVVIEICIHRPFYSIIPGHYRVCQGYMVRNGCFYLYINDPLPVGSSGTPKIELVSSQETKRIYVR